MNNIRPLLNETKSFSGFARKFFFLFGAVILFAQYVQCQEPRLVLPIGHTGPVNSAVFSPDGSLIVTASTDGTAKIWDVASGKMLQNLTGHTGGVNSAKFSSDGKYIITSSSEGTAKIWEVATGKMMQNLTGHSGALNCTQFSPDGKYIITASSWDKRVIIWDVSTGKLLKELTGHTSAVYSAQFSVDGKYIITSSSDSTAKIWKVSTGELVKNLAGHTSKVFSAQFSSNGKFIVTASYDGTAKIWDVATGEFLKDLKGHKHMLSSAEFSPDGKYIVTSSMDNTAKIWLVDSGVLFKDLTGHTNMLYSAHFSPDGYYIVTTSYDSTTKIWNASSGKLIHDLRGNGGYMNSANFSFDSKFLLTVSLKDTAKIWKVTSGELFAELKGQSVGISSTQTSSFDENIISVFEDETVKTWDLKTGKFLISLDGHKSKITDAKISSDEKYCVTASWDYTVKIWDISSGKLFKDMTFYHEGMCSIDFKSNTKEFLTASWDHKVKIWDVTTGKKIYDLKLPKYNLRSALFSPDGKYIITASRNGTAEVWDAGKRKLLHSLKVAYSNEKVAYRYDVTVAQFSPDSKYIVTQCSSGPVEIWDVLSGRVLHIIDGSNLDLSAQFSPNGKLIVTVSDNKTAKIWDVSSGELLKVLKGHNRGISSMRFSPDGNYIVTSSYDHTVKIWNISTGQILHDLKGHTASVSSAQFSTDGNYIISTDYDHKTIVWDAQTGKMLYTRLQLTSNDWLVYDEHYRYDGSPGAIDYLYFVCGLEIIDLKQLKKALYVPHLVEKIMNGEDLKEYPKLSELDICGALPIVETDETDTTGYRFTITPRRLGLSHAEVYINNKIVYTFKASELEFKDGVYLLELKEEDVATHLITGKTNEVKVVGVVYQEENELRSRGGNKPVFVKGEKVQPNLYALMIGVNEYKDPDLRLKYPVKDAQALGRALEISAKKLLGEDKVHVYYAISGVKQEETFTTPMKAGIRRALEEIGRKAKPEDVLLIFFAGHGVMQGNDEKLFTFLTADASEYNKVGISTKDLQSWLSYEGTCKMLANKAILIFDACNSGQALVELAAMQIRSDDETRRIRQVEDLKDKSGMFILAASAPNQDAYELGQYEQGLLTYSLLHNMKNNPQMLDENRYLNVGRWFDKSEEYLNQIAAKHTPGQKARPFGSANIRIGEVDEEVRSSIHLAEEKPLLVCVNALNAELIFDDLNLKDLINDELSLISERGTDNRFVYVGQSLPAANKISISYTTKSEKVSCRIKLIKDTPQQPLFDETITGEKSNMKELVSKIINEVLKHAK